MAKKKKERFEEGAPAAVRVEGGFNYEELEKIVNSPPPKKVIEAYEKYIKPVQEKLAESDRKMMMKMFGAKSMEELEKKLAKLREQAKELWEEREE